MEFARLPFISPLTTGIQKETTADWGDGWSWGGGGSGPREGGEEKQGGGGREGVRGLSHWDS